MRIELLAIVSMVAVVGSCAVDTMHTDMDNSEPANAVGTQDASCAGAEKYDELAQLSCKLGKPVDKSGFATERTLPAVSGESSVVRHYAGGCTGFGGCSRIAAEGWVAMSCGAFLYAYMDFTGDEGNLIASGTGVCLF